MRYLANLLSVLIGAVCIIMAIAAFNSVNNHEESAGHAWGMHVEEYRQDIEKKQMIGAAAGVVGGIFLLIGLIGFARGGRRKKDVSNFKEIDRLQKQALKFFNGRKYNEAIGVLLRLVEIDPGEGIHHFNLACAYSELKDERAFEQLSKAIAKGYSNYKKIESYNALSWMRNHPSYVAFVQSGYKDLKRESSAKREESVKSVPLNDDKLAQLEKLAKLKEQGILTDDEFLAEKKRILEGSSIG